MDVEQQSVRDREGGRHASSGERHATRGGGHGAGVTGWSMCIGGGQGLAEFFEAP